MPGDVPVWTLADKLFSTAGLRLGSDSTFFNGVEHALIGPAGENVVGLGSDPRIAYLNDQGLPIHVYGRQGAGPGEFRLIAGLFPVGDSVAVWDVLNRRLSFLFGGEVVVEVRLSSLPSPQNVFGLLKAGNITSTSDPAAEVFEGALEVVSAYHIWDRQGRKVRVLDGVTKPPPPVFHPVVRGKEGVGAGAYVRRGVCLPELLHAVDRDLIVIADSRNGTVYRLAPGGALSVSYRNSQVTRVTKETIVGVEGILRRAETNRGGRLTPESKRTILEQIGRVGDPLPSVWSRVVLDRENQHLWLERVDGFCFNDTDGPSSISWDVVGYEGGLVARAEIPSSLRVLAVGKNKVLGVATDALGVERVEAFRVEKRSMAVR